MNPIEQWFNGNKNYEEGVNIYASLPLCKISNLKVLKRGNSQRNMGLLVRELRLAKKKISNKLPDQQIPTVPTVKKKPPTKLPPKKTANTEATQLAQKTISFKNDFREITYASLPKQLRPRYNEARNMFYQECDIKFELNELPDEAESEALKLLIKIHELDEAQDLIWKEFAHWKTHKTILPITAEINFSDLDPKALFRKYKNTSISISKIRKRIDELYDTLDLEKDKHKIHLLERRITKSENTLHQHELNKTALKKMI